MTTGGSRRMSRNLNDQRIVAPGRGSSFDGRQIRVVWHRLRLRYCCSCFRRRSRLLLLNLALLLLGGFLVILSLRLLCLLLSPSAPTTVFFWTTTTTTSSGRRVCGDNDHRFLQVLRIVHPKRGGRPLENAFQRRVVASGSIWKKIG